MTLGAYLVRLLEKRGINTVFGIPGVHTIEMYRALAGSSIRHVTPRHEQGAGFMADGYARVTGKPGVCFLITGPGLTNAITAMAQAYADSIPMLVISAVNDMDTLGHGEGDLHESPNQSLLAAQVCAFSHRVLTPADLPKAMDRAFAVFESARPRPVHIEIPKNLFTASAEGLPDEPGKAPGKMRAPADAIEAAAALCRKAQRPMLLLGGGAKNAPAPALALAEALDAPAVMTTNARGILPPGHPLAVPASPSLQAVHDLMDASDLVLGFGTELGWTDYNVFDKGVKKPTAPFIRADIDPVQLTRVLPCDLALPGDCAQTMHDLLAALGDQPSRGSGAERAKKARAEARAELPGDYLEMIDVLEALRKTVPGAIFVGDSTQIVYAGNLWLEAEAPGRWFNSATGYGALGYGLPAAIGARCAAPKTPVICLTGDGGLQFVLGEFGAAVEVGGPLLVLVWNNFGYGEIKSAMKAKGVKPVGVDLHTPDFQRLAKAYDMQADIAARIQDIVPKARELLATGKPALLCYRCKRQ